MNLLVRIEKSKNFWFLLGTSFFFFLLRLPSLFEPYWYGDEGIYQTLGIAIQHGRLLYAGIWDNKPPFLYMLYALFNGDQFALRALSLLFGLVAIILFFFLAKRLFVKSPRATAATHTTTIFFALLTGLPIIEGNIANAENFMFVPILAASYLTLGYATNPKRWMLITSGLLLAAAFLFKVVAIFDAAAFTLFLLFVLYKNTQTILKQVFTLLPLVIAFTAPIAAVAFFFLLYGAFWDFFNASFKQNVGYVGYGNTFIISQGLLFLKLLALCIFTGLLFLKRTKISRELLFILLWLAFSLFNAFFSQRPYTHYLLVLIASLVLFVGALISMDGQTRLKRWGFITLLVLVLLITKNFWIYSKSFPYYQNFIGYVTGAKNTTDYQAFFDKNTPIDYALAQYVNMNTKKSDGIFIWGNNAQIYKLTNKLPPGRYTVAYHMVASKQAVNETARAVAKAKPRFVLIRTSDVALPFSLPNYVHKITIDSTAIYERVL